MQTSNIQDVICFDNSFITDMDVDRQSIGKNFFDTLC